MLSPSLLWTFDLASVARRNLYLERLSNTRTAWEILLEIESFREEVRHRRWESIPHQCLLLRSYGLACEHSQ